MTWPWCGNMPAAIPRRRLPPWCSQFIWRSIQRRFGRAIQFCGVAKPGCRNGVAIWAAKDLPARLDVVATAKLLGFAEHDIQILMAIGKLTPLGDPAPNAPKWFAAVETIRLAADQDWLHKATKEIFKCWRNKREQRMNPLTAVAAAD